MTSIAPGLDCPVKVSNLRSYLSENWIWDNFFSFQTIGLTQIRVRLWPTARSWLRQKALRVTFIQMEETTTTAAPASTSHSRLATSVCGWPASPPSSWSHSAAFSAFSSCPSCKKSSTSTSSSSWWPWPLGRCWATPFFTWFLTPWHQDPLVPYNISIFINLFRKSDFFLCQVTTFKGSIDTNRYQQGFKNLFYFLS